MSINFNNFCKKNKLKKNLELGTVSNLDGAMYDLTELIEQLKDELDEKCSTTNKTWDIMDEIDNKLKQLTIFDDIKNEK